MFRITRKRAATFACTIAAASITAGAFAFWTTDGSGSGSASVANGAQPVTLTATAPSNIVPGSSNEFTITAANPNADTSVEVGTVKTVVSVDAAHAACDVSDFSVADVVANQTIAKGATTALTAKGTLVFADSAVNQDACKGASLSLAFTS